jgi:hypothetical protein
MNKTRDPHCHVGVDSPFDPVSKFPWLIDIHQPCYTGARTTPQLMGGVHPSTKIHVGHRLAQAAWSLHYDHPEVAWTGPVVSACGIEAASGGKTLRVEFNTSLLGTDKILVRNYSKAEQVKLRNVSFRLRNVGFRLRNVGFASRLRPLSFGWGSPCRVTPGRICCTTTERHTGGTTLPGIQSTSAAAATATA